MPVTLDNVSLADVSDRLLLEGVSWERYEELLDEVERSGRHFRLTYDSGYLDVELPGQLHEVITAFARAMLDLYLIEHDILFTPFGQTTWVRKVLEKGLEADACYYIQNAAVIGSRIDIDLDRDPPPDLSIEVEAAKPLLPKLPVYVAMNMPEVWHVRVTGRVDIFVLSNGRFIAASESVAVPYFTAERIRKYSDLRLAIGHSEALRHFRSEMRA